MSVNCRTGSTLYNSWLTVLQNVPGCKKWQGLLAKINFVFDLFHILLNGFLRILKRKKLKEKHFCFIEKMIVQSVVLIIKKKKTTTTTTTKPIDRYITEDKYAKKNLICWFADHFIQRIKSSKQPVHKPAVPFPSSFRSPLKDKNSYKGYKINSSLKKLTEFLKIVAFDFDFVAQSSSPMKAQCC